MKATGSQVELGKTSPGPVPWSFLLTADLVALIALAVGTTDYYLASVVIASISGLTGVFRVAFRGSRAFCLTLANLAGVYACIFLFFAETDFRGAGALALSVGFILPLTAFVLGSFWHREAIVRVAISGQLREQRHLGRILTWLAPVFAIGVLASLVPASIAAGSENAVLLVAMLAISAIIVFVSRDIAVFLLDTGLLFEEFFHGWRASSCRPSPSSPAIRCS